MIQEWRQGEYIISTDKKRLDIAVVHGYLTRSYWAAGISIEKVSRAIEHSFCFGIYKGEQQVGFTRIVTDYTTYAYIADVFVLEPFRGQGLSKWLMRTIVDHPELQGLRLWTLRTKDAHGLYSQVGFTTPTAPERNMERFFPDVYSKR